MNFLGPKQYLFDMSGENPDNLITKEPLTLDPDDGTTIVIPNYAPFYAGGFKLYTPDGNLLYKDVDYRFYNLMGELTSYTNKPVVGIIELLRPELTKVLATYQTLGDTDFWDSNLIKLLINAAEDNRPVYWENLKDIPLGFPTEVHGQSFIYQLTSFTEFVNFIKDYTEQIKNNANLIELKLSNLVALIDSAVNRSRSMIEDLVRSHENTYNAHGLTKAHIGLSNVDNFPTATLDQARLGESNQLHLTPPGLAAIVNEFGYDESRLLENYSLPMSMYGNRNFIPPSIDGSFEAIGVTTNRAAYCIEEDGSLSVLSPRYDGKTKGLYFSRVTNFTDPLTIQYEYTAVKYEHPRLKTDGVSALSIMGGSDYRAMILGDDTSGNMYVTITNGTLNPEKHELKKIDITGTTFPIRTDALLISSLAFLGDRIAVMVREPRTVGPNTETFGSLRMFYIDIGDMDNATLNTVPLRDWFINYTMPDGVVVNNSQLLHLSPMSVDPLNTSKMKQLYYTFPSSLSANGGGYRSCNVVSTINPNNENESVINVNRSFYMTYRDSDDVLRSHGMHSVEVIWKRNGDVFTLSDFTPIHDMYLSNLGLTQHSTANERVSTFANQSSCMLSNGWRATCRSGNGEHGWNNALVAEQCNKSPWEWLTKCSYTANHSINRVGVSEKVSSPTRRGVKPVEVTWTRHGYEVTHLGQIGGTFIKTDVKLHQTSAKSNLPFYNWEPRNEVSIQGESVPSLPIPTPAQETELVEPYNRPNSNITGDSAFLSSVSTGYGLNVKGNWGQNRGVGGMGVFDSTLAAGTDDGVLLYDSAGDLLYYPAVIVNQLKALVDTAGVHPVKGVSICDFTANVNKYNGYVGSWNPNLSVVIVTFGKYSVSTPSKFARLLVIRPVISNNTGNLYNSNYPRIVTGFTILDQSGDRQLTSNESGMTDTTWGLSTIASVGSQKRMFQGYVRGNQMDFAFETMMYSGIIGSSTTTSFTGVIDLSTGAIVTTSHYGLGSGWNTAARLAVPRMGLLTTNSSPVSYGGCALVAGFGASRCCIYNTFLKDGWFVYIGESDVVFYGAVEKLPAQVIDVRTITAGYMNTTFYLYVRKQLNGQKEFYLSKDKVVDSPYHMWIGTVETDSAGIKSITRQNVLSLNGIRVGVGRGGSTIMASSGSVNSFGTIPWFTREDIV